MPSLHVTGQAREPSAVASTSLDAATSVGIAANRRTPTAAELAALRGRYDAAHATFLRLIHVVDGETRASRRRALCDVAEDLGQLAREVSASFIGKDAASVREDADWIVSAIRQHTSGVHQTSARRRRQPVAVKVIPLVVALVALFGRAASLHRDDAEGGALRALYFFLVEWLEAWWNIDDYLAAGFACQMGRAPGAVPVWFRSDTAERRAAEKTAREEADKRARWAAEKAEPWVERALREDAALAPGERLRRCRTHLNSAHTYVAEASQPFPGDQVRHDRLGDAIDTAAGFLRLCAADLVSAEGAPELAEELATCRVAVARVRGQHEAAIAAIRVAR